MTRRATFDRYSEYHMQPNDASMDEICKRGAFELQKHQLFLQKWTTENKWRTLLLYHEIGSGKTCTSITIAEAFGGKVKVILPATLRTNYITELLGQCTGRKYADESALANYDISSIETFRNEAMRHPNLKEFIAQYTKNSLIIIDEVQNVISSQVEQKTVDEILSTGVIHGRPSGIHAILVRALTFFAHPTAKFVFLTATPIFDNIKEIHQLALLLNDCESDRVPPEYLLSGQGAPHFSISDFVDLFRNKVSYFPRLSANAYPRVLNIKVNVRVTETVDKKLGALESVNPFDNDEEDLNESFLAKQRQVALFCGKEKRVDDAYLREHAPKIYECLQHILDPSNVGKHCVYCSFVEKGLDILRAALEARGWGEDKGDYHRFVVWKGGLSDRDKTRYMQRLNSSENIDGRNIRLVLGSPAIKEGISFLHMQYMHILDSSWNMASIRQIEGRVNRYCSHVAITADIQRETGLKRQVQIRTYFLTRPRGNPTVDEKILRIVEKKLLRTAKGELMLQNVALDHWLFHELRGKPHPSDKKGSPGDRASPVYHEAAALKGTKGRNVCGPGGNMVKNDQKCKDGEHEFQAWHNDRVVKCCNKDMAIANKGQRKFEKKSKKTRKAESSESEVEVVQRPTGKKKARTHRVSSEDVDSDVEIIGTEAQKKYGSRLNVLRAEQRDAVELNPTVKAAKDFLSGASASSSRNTREKAQLALDAIEFMNSF